MKYTETSIKPEAQRDTIRMLLKLILTQNLTTHETYYTAIQQKMHDSTTIKLFFDNLTALRHWNWMTPDPLENIIKDVKNDEIHQR